MVKKKDGSWRFCVDYKQLNKLTIKDRLPNRLVKELLDELVQAVNSWVAHLIHLECVGYDIK